MMTTDQRRHLPRGGHSRVQGHDSLNVLANGKPGDAERLRTVLDGGLRTRRRHAPTPRGG